MKAGDVITAVNGQDVSDPMELRREVGRTDEGKATDLSVVRDKKTLTLKVEPAEASKPSRPRVRRTV